MRKIKKIIFAAIIFVLLVAGAVVGLPVSADSDHSAVIIRDSSCGMLDGNKSFTSTDDSQAVFSNDANGNSQIICRGQVKPNVYGDLVIWNYENTGLLCGTAFGVTKDWQEVVTPSGQATLTCHINPSS